MAERLFTVDEANALIPRLELLMGKLQRNGLSLREHITELSAHTGQPAEEITTTHLLELRPHLRPMLDELQALLGELDSFGVQMKGLDLGLIDFPAELNGDIVLLCWQYGEKEVAHYHTLDAGFAGRKPLDPKTSRPKYLQ